MEGAAVLDDVLRHGGLLVQVHLGPDHVLALPLRQMSLLHQSLKLEILLAGDHDDLAWVNILPRNPFIYSIGIFVNSYLTHFVLVLERLLKT